jgi:hypothetical protein
MAFSDFSLTGGILFTMWFLIAAFALSVLLIIFYRLRQQSGETVSDKDKMRMEVSSDIGIPLEALDPEKAGHIERRAGVALPRAPQGEERSEHEGSLASRNLRKTALSKEVELAWEAGKIIEFQPGAWAVPKDTTRSKKFAVTRTKGGMSTRRAEYHPFPGEYSLPQRYGTNRLVLMARDPNWVYAYWEVTHEKYREMYERHLHDWGLSRPVLRIYDITPAIGEKTSMNVFLNDEADNWYLNVGRPRHTIMAELGRLFPENAFFCLVRSNVITLPAGDLSDEISLKWAPLGWQRSYSDFKTKVGTSSPGIWGKTPQ